MGIHLRLEKVALGALTLCLLACTPGPLPAAAVPATPKEGCQGVNPYRDKARYVLEVHCGQCHRQDSPEAQARALAVFNLNELDWAHSLDTRQLEELVTRIQGRAPAQETEDVAVLQRFMEAELGLRACR
jgi:hypothetical protein